MNELIGKSVLVGITCVAPDGAELDRFQTVNCSDAESLLTLRGIGFVSQR